MAPRWPGRWSLVHRIGVWGKEVPLEERIARQARQLLQCYGIVTRESVRVWELGGGEGEGEKALDWPALYTQFQLMEMRGEVRRGYFVQGLPGVQFALPEAVERLRTWSRPQTPSAEESILSASLEDPVEGLVVLNANDPANLFGLALPGQEETENDPARFTRIPGNYVVLLRGRPVLLLETGGERVTTLPDMPPDTLKRALGLVVEHVGGSQRQLTLKEWTGEPVLENPYAPLLEGLGFRREALVYVWEG
jgi:ATP-dependent Lhr-like helicase